MNIKFYFFIFIAVISIYISIVYAQTISHHNFKSSITPIPLNVQKKMRKYSWKPECPISLNDLAYVKLTYWGFDNKPHTGILIINKELAPEIVKIFQALYYNKFPIQKIEPMDTFKGDDIKAMEANNTSAFNCRMKTGKQNEFSLHSYGRAIDINTMINPYVKGDNILPTNGIPFVDRNTPYPGKIIKGDSIYNEFIKYGWKWGGNWVELKDYQHFEKK